MAPVSLPSSSAKGPAAGQRPGDLDALAQDGVVVPFGVAAVGVIEHGRRGAGGGGQPYAAARARCHARDGDPELHAARHAPADRVDVQVEALGRALAGAHLRDHALDRGEGAFRRIRAARGP